MSKKPNFATSKEKRLLEAQQELEQESTIKKNNTEKKTVQTTLILEEDLHIAVQEVGLKRKRAGIKPYTLVGIVRAALQEIVDKENT